MPRSFFYGSQEIQFEYSCSNEPWNNKIQIIYDNDNNIRYSSTKDKPDLYKDYKSIGYKVKKINEKSFRIELWIIFDWIN